MKFSGPDYLFGGGGGGGGARRGEAIGLYSLFLWGPPHIKRYRELWESLHIFKHRLDADSARLVKQSLLRSLPASSLLHLVVLAVNMSHGYYDCYRLPGPTKLRTAALIVSGFEARGIVRGIFSKIWAYVDCSNKWGLRRDDMGSLEDCIVVIASPSFLTSHGGGVGRLKFRGEGLILENSYVAIIEGLPFAACMKAEGSSERSANPEPRKRSHGSLH